MVPRDTQPVILTADVFHFEKKISRCQVSCSPYHFLVKNASELFRRALLKILEGSRLLASTSSTRSMSGFCAAVDTAACTQNFGRILQVFVDAATTAAAVALLAAGLAAAATQHQQQRCLLLLLCCWCCCCSYCCAAAAVAAIAFA